MTDMAERIAKLPAMPGYVARYDCYHERADDPDGDCSYGMECGDGYVEADTFEALRARNELLAEVIEQYLDPLITGHCGDSACDECARHVAQRAVLAACKVQP